MRTFKKLLFLLNSNERKRASLLLIMILIMALSDMIGVASILPFMAVLTNPGLIETNLILNTMFQASSSFGVENNQQFLFALGVILFATLIISLAFKALTTHVQVQWVQMREYSIGKRLVEGYLHQPYSWFLDRNSADLGKTILSEVNQVVGNGINPVMELIAKGTVIISLTTLLIIVDPKLAIIVGFTLAGFYGLILYFLRKYLNRIGKERLKNNQLRFISISEAFGAFKEVKVAGLEKNYIKKFSNSAEIYARTLASALVTAQLPRFILEAIGFGGILLIILYIMAQTDNFNNALPIVSLYVFAGYRLMPAINHMYSSFIQLTFVGPSLDKLYEDLQNLKTFTVKQDDDIITLNKKISLKNIHYNYPNTSRTAIKNISLTILAKSTVGIVGATGSGKTTIVDIILGLLESQKGTLEIDEKVITKQNLKSWQRSIGYVPQHIYLSDDTVAANIAFGIETKDIDLIAVEKAAKIANLHKFLIEELPKQYQTIVGERGVRLSGGQRQRIGIARALYHNPNILILDEATSALDNQTEKAVMDAVNNLRKNITIILIAHRLDTVKNCDKIFLLENGQLKNEISYEELMNINEDFRKTVNT
jgi:ABC-type multidrug transport system fused ATPase/permease subunit